MQNTVHCFRAKHRSGIAQDEKKASSDERIPWQEEGNVLFFTHFTCFKYAMVKFFRPYLGELVTTFPS